MSQMKTYLIIITLFIGVFSCSSNKVSETEEIKDKKVEKGQSLLWKLEGNNCQTSYMYGTMHMINSEYYNFTKSMKDKVKSSDAIIMEVGGMPNPLKTFQLMSLDSGSVHDYFSEEQISLLLEFMDTELDTSPEEFHQLYGGMKPFFILQAISQAYFGDETESYDLDIMLIANENNIPLIGLETIEEQLGFFDALSHEEMAGLIMDAVENFDDEKKETLKMMEIYSEQKVDKLVPFMKKQSPELMQFSDIFLYNRNKAWIPKIKEEVKDKSCFIAVGAAHLFGEDGVIDLLKKEGYTLTPISTN